MPAGLIPYNILVTIYEILYLAMGCSMLGIILTFVVLLACQYLGIDISRNSWVLAIPVTLAVALNVLFIELYRRHKKKW